MTLQEISYLTRKIRTLKVRINTLKTIYQDLPLTPKGLTVPQSYNIMTEAVNETIMDWETQLVALENKFLFL
jgi:hypothetical protein